MVNVILSLNTSAGAAVLASVWGGGVAARECIREDDLEEALVLLWYTPDISVNFLACAFALEMILLLLLSVFIIEVFWRSV